MKPRFGFALPVIIVIALALAAFAVQAQDPGTDTGQGDKDAGAEVMGPEASGEAGIGNPPPAGFAILYMFTGVANESDAGRDEATSINCTNFHPSTSVEVRVEVYGYNAGSPYAGNQVIPSGGTRTWSTQSIVAYNDGFILPAVGYIFQGSGRVLVREHALVICNAQVLDADADPPVYAVDLEMFRR